MKTMVTYYIDTEILKKIEKIKEFLGDEISKFFKKKVSNSNVVEYAIIKLYENMPKIKLRR